MPAHRHSLIRSGLIGILGLGFDVTLLALLVRFASLPRWAAIALAFAVTYLLNFTLNRRFAFAASDAPPGPIGRQFVRFMPQLALDLALTLMSVRVLTATGLPLLAARVLAGGSNAAVNYIAYRWWTFRSPAVPPGSRDRSRPPPRRDRRPRSPHPHGLTARSEVLPGPLKSAESALPLSSD